MRGRCGDGYKAPRLTFRCEGWLGGSQNTPIVSKCEREVWGWVQSHPSRVSTRGGVEGRSKQPRFAFPHKGWLEGSQNPLHCIKTQEGGVGGGYKATHLAFWHEEVLGGGQNTPIVSKHKREVWGVGTKRSVSRFDVRRYWGAVETPPSRRNARGRRGSVPISCFDAREGWEYGGGMVVMSWGCHQQHCYCWCRPSPFGLRRLVRTGFSRSSKFRAGERLKTRLRSWSFPVLGISGPHSVLVQSSPGLLVVLRLDLQALANGRCKIRSRAGSLDLYAPYRQPNIEVAVSAHDRLKMDICESYMMDSTKTMYIRSDSSDISRIKG